MLGIIDGRCFNAYALARVKSPFYIMIKMIHFRPPSRGNVINTSLVKDPTQ